MILREGLDLIHELAHVPLRATIQGLLPEQSEPQLHCGVLVRGVALRSAAEGKRRRPPWTPPTSPANHATLAECHRASPVRRSSSPEPRSGRNQRQGRTAADRSYRNPCDWGRYARTRASSRAAAVDRPGSDKARADQPFWDSAPER